VTPGPPAPGAHSEADVAFVTHLVPHHRQALELCRRALEHSNDPGVIALARQVRDDQSQELAALVGWLKGWNATVPEGIGGRLGGHNDITDGSMSDNDWNDLAAVPPRDLDVAVLRYLQFHNTGTRIFAAAYLDNELDRPENRAVRALALSMRKNRSERGRQIGQILQRLSQNP
jgi:uncharacterized protein (DUF305 family)